MDTTQTEAKVKTIREHRAALGLSQMKLAARADLSLPTVINLEKGADISWAASTMRKVSEALGVPVDRIAEFRKALGL